MAPAPIPDATERLANRVWHAARDVYFELGPGLLEKVYVDCLEYLLIREGLRVDREVRVPIRFRGVDLGHHVRLDLLIDDDLVVEVKATSEHPLHRAQLLSQLRLTERRLGILLNFNQPVFRGVFRRVAN